MTTYVALSLFAMLLISVVILLVRRDRQERDLDRRALARSLVRLGIRNAELAARTVQCGEPVTERGSSDDSRPNQTGPDRRTAQ